MKHLKFLKSGAALALCFAVLTACAPNGETDVPTTTGATSATTVTSITPLPTTTETPTTTTSTVTTTTTKTTVAPTTTTSTAPTPSTSSTVIPSQSLTVPAGELSFSYESEDYDRLRRWLAGKFPGEKNWDEFVVSKQYESTPREGAVYRVEFTRYINGCATEADYDMFFNENEQLTVCQYRSPKYDPSTVKPPRVATEAEIEAGKQDALKKTQAKDKNAVVVSQEVIRSRYDISIDRNYFIVRTYYGNQKFWEMQGYFDENSPNYGKELPVYSVHTEVYEIPR